MTKDKKSKDVISSDTQEEAFFAQESMEEESPQPGAMEIDEDLLWNSQGEVVIPPLWQPVVPLALALVSLFILYVFVDDFRFALSTNQALDLGSVIDGCPDNFYQKIPHNRVVKLRGVVPQPNLTAQASVHFSKRYYVVALGCDLLVSLHEKRYQELLGTTPKKPKRPARVLPIPRSLRKKLGHKATITFQTRNTLSNTQFVVRGRALRANSSSAIDNLRQFYAVTESMSFTPHTHIIFDGEEPSNQQWVLLVYAILTIFSAYNLWRFLKALSRLKSEV